LPLEFLEVGKTTPTLIPSLKLTASSPLKMDGWNSSNFLFGAFRPIFWCKLAVSFRQSHLGKFLQFINPQCFEHYGGNIWGIPFPVIMEVKNGSGPSTMSFSYKIRIVFH